MRFAPEYVRIVLNENFEDAKELLLSPLMAIHYAHLVMLAEQGIVSPDDARVLRSALDAISLDSVREVAYDGTYEDLFFFIERLIKNAAGEDIAGRLHTARSRNDIDMTMYRMRQREFIVRLIDAVVELRKVLIDLASRHRGTLFAAHTHTQFGTPWSANVKPFQAISQEACGFVFDQALFDDEEVEVLSYDGGKRIGAALGHCGDDLGCAVVLGADERPEHRRVAVRGDAQAVEAVRAEADGRHLGALGAVEVAHGQPVVRLEQDRGRRPAANAMTLPCGIARDEPGDEQSRTRGGGHDYAFAGSFASWASASAMSCSASSRLPAASSFLTSFSTARRLYDWFQ